MFGYLNTLEGHIIRKLMAVANSAMMPKHNFNFFTSVINNKPAETSILNRRVFDVKCIADILEHLNIDENEIQ